jgi:uncharacterized SAM-binding protein YcdF (DUF218 family)
MEPQSKADSASTERRRTRRILFGLAGVALLSAAVFLLCLGRGSSPKTLEKAQAIVVLKGACPCGPWKQRNYIEKGFAPKVWLTRPTEPGAALEAMGIPFVGEDFYNSRILMHEGVPADAIRVLQPSVLNTADELTAVSAALAEERSSKVIIVTSKVHTRRVQILWHRIAAGGGQALVRAAADDPVEPGRWWHTTGDALDVVREFLGILNAWAGMPLHPAN